MTQNVERTGRFVEKAVEMIRREAELAVKERGQFRLSLCGGSTPAAVYRALAKVEDFPWAQTLITFGDERCYPADHERSNYRMAKESFIGQVALADEQVIRMKGELQPDTAARECEASLRSHMNSGDESIFTHDLLLLGMGDDGHTASLFPDTDALQEQERWVVANYVPKFEEHRITFTYPLINAARHVCFLVTGDAKRPIYEAIFAGEGDHFPASQVRPTSRQTTWLIGE